MRKRVTISLDEVHLLEEGDSLVVRTGRMIALIRKGLSGEREMDITVTPEEEGKIPDVRVTFRAYNKENT